MWIKIFDKSIFWLGDDNVVGTNIAGPEILNPEFCLIFWPCCFSMVMLGFSS